MSRAIASAFAIHSLSLLLAANAVASTQPGDKPLSEILVPVEAHGTVISADQGRNRWEVVVCERIGNCTEVYLDRATGQELRREHLAKRRVVTPPAHPGQVEIQCGGALLLVADGAHRTAAGVGTAEHQLGHPLRVPGRVGHRHQAPDQQIAPRSRALVFHPSTPVRDSKVPTISSTLSSPWRGMPASRAKLLKSCDASCEQMPPLTQ